MVLFIDSGYKDAHPLLKAVYAPLRKFKELGQETTAKSRQERGKRKYKLKTSLGRIRIWCYKHFCWFKCKIRSGIDQLGLFIFVFAEGNCYVT